MIFCFEITVIFILRFFQQLWETHQIFHDQKLTHLPKNKMQSELSSKFPSKSINFDFSFDSRDFWRVAWPIFTKQKFRQRSYIKKPSRKWKIQQWYSDRKRCKRNWKTIKVTKETPIIWVFNSHSYWGEDWTKDLKTRQNFSHLSKFAFTFLIFLIDVS